MNFFKSRPSGDTAPNAANNLGRRQRRLLSETVLIEEELLPSFIRPMIAVILLTTIGFIAWAALTKIKEVAVAPGEVIPAAKVKVVQHLDGGIVSEILVEERMTVAAGAVLLRLDGTQALSDMRQMEARRASLLLRAERLAAFAEERLPDFSRVDGYDDMVADQEDTLRTQQAARQSTLSILDQQLAQRVQRIAQQEKSLSSAEEHERLTGELVGMREDLATRRLVNRTILLETRRARVTAEGEVARLKDEIAVSRQELAETRNRRIDTVNQLRREASKEAGAVRAELAEVEESIQRLKAKVDRLDVRSPSAGLVQDLRAQTIGQVILPAALLMQIVPVSLQLEAEVRISPRDIGHVRVGQDVNLRVSSYDYTRFGHALGTLKRVSATSLTDPQSNQLYYRGWVTITRPYVGDVQGQHLLQPGMSLEADIRTGEKTLLAYIFKPVTDALSRSFHER